MHDGPAQLVSALVMNVRFVQTLLDEDALDMAKQELTSMEDLATRALKQMRELLFNQRPLVLETQGLIPALETYVARLKADQIEKPTEIDKMHKRVMEIIGDPLPYGIAPNRKVLEELIQHALAQSIIAKPVTVDELFTPSTRAPRTRKARQRLATPAPDPAATAARLRNGRPPVFCRADDGLLVFDLRTVPPESDDRLVRAVRYALGQA